MTRTSDELKPALLLLGVGLLLAVFAFWNGLAELVYRWGRQEEYSHGFLIPGIVIWLLWQRRTALRDSVGRPSWWAVPVLLLVVTMLVIGELTAIFLLLQLGFLLAIVGLVLAFGGVSLLRVTVFPIALLLFCIPLPYFIDSQLSWRLQLLSSWLGVEVLRVLGYSVFLEGNVIDLGVFRLQVVEACSGLRYLYPLMSVGFLMAYMYRGALRWKALIFLATIPLTLVMNSTRIAVVGILVDRWGAGMADGFMHYFEGWVIFMVCVAVLAALVKLIEYFGRRRPLMNVLVFPKVDAASPAPDLSRGLSYRPLMVMLGLLAVAVAAGKATGGREEIRPERQLLVNFPLHLAGWQGRVQPMDSNVERALGLDDYIIIDYVNSERQRVNFYVAYYGSQRKGVSPHSPQVCIPGGGWVISSLGRMLVTMPDGSIFEVVRVRVDRAGERQLVYYWFEQRGRHIANEYAMKWYLLQDALLRNRSDGALVRLVTTIDQIEDEKVADARLVEVLGQTIGHLKKFVPN